jgi:hypothetical protein
MISLHLECETSKDLREKLLVLLGIAEHPLAFQHTEPVKVTTQPGEFRTATAPLGSVTVPEPTPITNVPGTETETAARKLRGRPRKVVEAVPETTPAEVKPIEQTKPEPAVPIAPATPPTMFDVTPSEYAKTAPVPTAPTPAVQTPAADVTFEKVKEALQKVAAVRPTDTNDMAGLNRATLIIGTVQTGCRKIKDIKPENYAAVLAACLTA